MCGLPLGIGLAAEALAEAAILALPELHAVGVGVGPRGVGRRPRVGVIAKLGRGLAEQLAAMIGDERRIGIIARTRILERIAARLNLPLDIAGLAGNTRRVFELVVIGLDHRSVDPPVLVRHLGRDALLA